MCAQKIKPKRKINWTKHTNYASLRGPAEVSTAVTAGIKSMDQQLAANQSFITSIGRKSISRIEHERKMVEKSMVAYTKKVKVITDNRTNDLFREIHNRNSYRADQTKVNDDMNLISDTTPRKAKHHRGTGLMLKQLRALELRVRSPDDELSIISEAITTITEPWSHATETLANSVKLKSILRRVNSATEMDRNPLEEEEPGASMDNKITDRNDDSSHKQNVKFANSMLLLEENINSEDSRAMCSGTSLTLSKKVALPKKDIVGRDKSDIRARKSANPESEHDLRHLRFKHGYLGPLIPEEESKVDEVVGNDSAESDTSDSGSSAELTQASAKRNTSGIKKRRFVKKRNRNKSTSKTNDRVAKSATPRNVKKK